MDFSQKLTRSMSDRMLFGICGGLGAYTGVDSTIIRLVLVFLTIFTCFFPFIFIYLVAAVIVPADGPMPTAQSEAPASPATPPPAPAASTVDEPTALNLATTPEPMPATDIPTASDNVPREHDDQPPASV